MFYIRPAIICLKCWQANLSIEVSMPKYAVAVGRQVGIYDTYDECKQQVLKFPNAKFKKFHSVEDAEEFIKQFSGGSSSSCDSVAQFRYENINKPDLIKLGSVTPNIPSFNNTCKKVSAADGKLNAFRSVASPKIETSRLNIMEGNPNPTLNTICDRIRSLEEKLNSFINETSSKIESVVCRLTLLEGKRSTTGLENEEPQAKKVKATNVEIDLDLDLVDKFSLSKEGFVIVYTDGACTNNGRSGAKAGIGVWFGADHPLNVSAPVKGSPTNNTAEIQAARIAIRQAAKHGVKKLDIHTDSKFLISCITEWIHKWKRNDWKLTSGGPVKNKEELVKLDASIQSMAAVKWNYVAGHKGVHGNEMADLLARKGAEKYETNVTYSRNSGFADEPDQTS